MPYKEDNLYYSFISKINYLKLICVLSIYKKIMKKATISGNKIGG
jgi:hypothetical protein